MVSRYSRSPCQQTHGSEVVEKDVKTIAIYKLSKNLYNLRVMYTFAMWVRNGNTIRASVVDENDQPVGKELRYSCG